VKYFPTVNFCNNECKYCVERMKHLLYSTDNYISIAYLNDVLSADIILDLLESGRIIDQQIISRYMPIDRHVSLLLLENGAIFSETFIYVNEDEVRAKYVTGYLWHIEIDLDFVYPNIYNAQTFYMLLAELRRIKILSGDEELVCRYSHMSDCLMHFSYHLYGPLKNELIELFPLFVFCDNCGITQARDANVLITADICSIELIDRVMSFSKHSKYIDAVKSILRKFLEAAAAAYDSDYITDIARLIIERHPQYLNYILRAPPLQSEHNIFLPRINLSGYGPQLIFDNIRHDYELMKYLKFHRQNPISESDINILINQKSYDTLNTSRLSYDRALSTDLYTIFDLIVINCGIAAESVTPDIISAYINQITSDNELSINMKYAVNEFGIVLNEHSLRHMINLVSKDARILNLIASITYIELLPAIYENFWRRFRAICRLCARCGLPDDVRDLMLIYYIRPGADNDEIAQMLFLQREP
jgi:hypothetical protein